LSLLAVVVGALMVVEVAVRVVTARLLVLL
jgi:hypothetical protein